MYLSKSASVAPGRLARRALTRASSPSGMGRRTTRLGSRLERPSTLATGFVTFLKYPKPRLTGQLFRDVRSGCWTKGRAILSRARKAVPVSAWIRTIVLANGAVWLGAAMGGCGDTE